MPLFHGLFENPRREAMTDNPDAAPFSMARRDFLTSGAALAIGLGAANTAIAQATDTASKPPPTGSTVVVERMEGGILLIKINRPEAKNRLDPVTLTALGKAYYQFEHDDELRVAVLHAEGPDFAPGLDAPAFGAALAAGQWPPKDPDYISAVGITETRWTKPVVVAVQGATKFIGHELFLAADVRVASNDTKFAQAEVTVGLVAAGGGTTRFAREAGWGNAMRYMLTGDEWGADEAYRMGLVQFVTPPGQQLPRAIEVAKKIAAAAPLGVRATLASAHSALTASETAVLAALQPEFRRLQQSADRQEYLRAQKEGRPAVFHGI
jgi:enoyl-CoA hydratase